MTYITARSIPSTYPVRVPAPVYYVPQPVAAAQPLWQEPEQEDDAAFSPVTVLVALLGVLMIAVTIASGSSPWIVAFLLASVFGTLALLNPRSCIFLTLPFLAVMGDLRRIVSLGMAQGSDPIVLVGPMMVMLLTAIAVLQDRLTRRTRISRQMMIVLAIMLVQVFNPYQGRIQVGAIGILCIVVPMCWFWVGQAWGSQRFVETLFFRAIVPVAVAAGILGLAQVFIGRPSYQEEWMRWRFAGRSLVGGDAARPFGFFVSISEFTKYLSVGIILVLSSLIAGKFRLWVFAVPAMAVALFLSSARGPVILVSGVLILLWAMKSRSKKGVIFRTSLAALIIGGGMFWALSQVNEMTYASPDLEFLVKHQTEGLLNPFDAEKSTGAGHASLVLLGILEGFKHPFGLGLGVTTHLSGAYGVQFAGTEIDISNMFVSLGVVGGVAYAMLYFKVFRTAIDYWRATRTPIAMSLAAVLMLIAGSWLNTGEYSTISLVWFCVGALDRMSARAGVGGLA